MGTGPHARVCIFRPEGNHKGHSSGAIYGCLGWVLFCLILILVVKMTGLGLGKHARIADQQIPGVAYLCLPSTGITNVSHHTPLFSLF